MGRGPGLRAHGLGPNSKLPYTQLKCITPLSPSQVLVCSTILGEIIQVVLELELGHPMSISLPIAIHPFYLHLLSESMHP